jgi:hypothetical protein
VRRAATTGRRATAIIALAGVCSAGGVALANTTRAPITGGTVTLGVGGDGVTLGMTRAQVIARLGRPVYQNKNGYMQYGPKNTRDLFDVYRTGSRAGSRVHLMIISGQRRSFRMKNGTAIFAAGGLRRIAAEFGSRLQYENTVNNGASYQLHTTLHGRKVTTSLSVDKPVARGGHVIEVDIYYSA